MIRKAIVFGLLCIVVITSVLLSIYHNRDIILRKLIPSAYTSVAADSVQSVKLVKNN